MRYEAARIFDIDFDRVDQTSKQSANQLFEMYIDFILFFNYYSMRNITHIKLKSSSL